MSQSKSVTPARPVSTPDPFVERVKLQTLAAQAFCTWASDRLGEFASTSDALLHAALKYRSQGNSRAAQAELERAREEFKSVIGPSRVRDLHDSM